MRLSPATNLSSILSRGLSSFALCLLLLGSSLEGLSQIFPQRNIQIDTTRQDSVNPLYDADREVDPETRRVYPEALFAHREPAEQLVEVQMERLMYFDPLDSVQGFRQTLGQIGKPYQVSRFGFNDRHFVKDSWRNPVFGRYNVYVKNPETETPYFDTKTQYLNLDYAQGGRSLQLLDGILSRNISPEWNVTGLYQSRRSNSAYQDLASSQRVVVTGLYHRSRNRRYHLFVNGSYHELQDGINGGMFRDETTTDEQTFDKAVENPMLTEAVMFRIFRSVHVDQMYHLLGHRAGAPRPLPDSLRDPAQKPPTYESRSVQRLSLRFQARIANGYQRFRDRGIDTTRNQASLAPPLPMLASGFNAVSHEQKHTDLNLRGSASYSVEWPGRLYWNLQGSLGYRRLWFQLSGSELADDRTQQQVKSDLYIKPLRLRQRVRAYRTGSSLFNGETYAYADLEFAPRLRKAQPDSLAAADSSQQARFQGIRTLNPIQLQAAISFHDQNPSVFQAFYPQREFLNFQARPDLRNMQLFHARGGLRLQGNRPLVGREQSSEQDRYPSGYARGRDTAFANYLSVLGFISSSSRFIYYTTDFEVEQAAQGEALSWVGVELAGRLRFLKKWYAEGNMTLQQGTTSATSELSRYAAHLPGFHSRLALYYDNRNVAFAGKFRIGAELHFFSSYQALGMDAFSGEFYPTDYTLPAYPRLDLFAMTQIKKAYLWLRLIHSNELLLARGYYSTPFYPELERTFSFGVNWTFFD
jgi:hypothetical protein